MGLSTRELLLIIRARDEASRTLTRISQNMQTAQLQEISGMKNITAQQRSQMRDAVAAKKTAAEARQVAGMALTTTGVAMVGVGAKMVSALNDMGNASIEYAQQAAVSFTQVEDKATDSLKGIEQMGLSVAQRFAVNFEEIQPAIYDIFSSVEAKGKDAKILLDGIATAAIGGATDMLTASNSIIGIMNAWGLKAKDVTKINDQMFQLVRKGRGTYQQFTAAMGKSIPSAKNASQSVEELSAMLMFLTRNGVSTSMAGTSAARAMDLLTNPKFEENMNKFGMSVYDAQGKMKPMSQVVQDLKSNMKGLNLKEQAQRWRDLAGGAGNNIQARRFFNLALTDSNNLYRKMQGYAKDAGGAADEAYKIMSNTPEAKIKILANEMEVFKVTFGDAVKDIKAFISEALTPLLNWFNGLSPEVKKNIIIFGLVTGAILVLSGVIIAVVGTIMMFSGILVLLGGSLGTIGGIVAGVVGGIALLAGAAYLIIANWGSITSWWDGVWAEIQRTVQPAIDGIMKGVQPLIDGWKWFTEAIQPGVDAISGAFQNLGAAIGPILNWIIAIIVAVFIPIWDTVAGAVGGALGGIGRIFSGLLLIISGVINFISALFTGNWAALWESVKQIFWGVWQTVIGLLQTIGGTIAGIVMGVINGIIGFFTYLYDVIVGHSIIPDLIIAIIDWFTKLPGRIFDLISGFVSGVVEFIGSLPEKALAAIGPLATYLHDAAVNAWDRFKDAVITGTNGVVSFVKGIPGKIVSAIGNVGGLLYDAGKNILEGFLNGLKSIWDNIQGFVGNIATWIKDHKGPLSYDFQLLVPAGRKIMEGLEWGLRSRFGNIRTTVAEINSLLSTDGSGYRTAIDFGGQANSSYLTGTDSSSANNSKIDITVNTQEIDPIKHSADLGYELAARLNL